MKRQVPISPIWYINGQRSHLVFQKLKSDYLIATAPKTRKTAILHMQPILLARDIAVDLSYPTKKEIKTYFFKPRKAKLFLLVWILNICSNKLLLIRWSENLYSNMLISNKHQSLPDSYRNQSLLLSFWKSQELIERFHRSNRLLKQELHRRVWNNRLSIWTTNKILNILRNCRNS